MACVRKRRVGKGSRWVLDYRDQQGRRHWETTKGNRKEAEGLLAERVREIGRGTYRAPAERITFEDLGGEHPKRIQALMGHSSINVTMDVYGHLMPGGGGEVADRLGALVFRGSGSITVQRDEIDLADHAQAIVSIGGRTFDPSGSGIMTDLLERRRIY